jgi:hypothetical protein
MLIAKVQLNLEGNTCEMFLDNQAKQNVKKIIISNMIMKGNKWPKNMNEKCYHSN